MDASVSVTLVVTASLTIAAAIVLWVLSGWPAAAAALAGSAAATINYLFLVRSVNKLTADVSGHSGAGFAARFLLMGLTLFGMIALLKLSPVGVIVGVTMILPGVVVGISVGWKS